MTRKPQPTNAERGTTLIEVLIALIVLTVGLIAVAQLFPAGARAQVQDHLLSGANDYAQQMVEELSTKPWIDPDLTAGRHPSVGTVDLGAYNEWHRFYFVTDMAAPLDNLKRVDVTVTYAGAALSSTRSVVATTYVRK